MGESSEEFRDELRAVVRRYDPSPEQLRETASRLEALADRHEQVNEVL
ncbi:hypothetical protein [Halorussus halobius]|nr:hypothetical protein [Halorussus halobius]